MNKEGRSDQIKSEGAEANSNKRKNVEHEYLEVRDDIRRTEVIISKRLEEGKKKPIMKVDRSKTLELAKQFIPKLAEANEEMKKRELNGEYDTKECKNGPYLELGISMIISRSKEKFFFKIPKNLGMGVFELASGSEDILKKILQSKKTPNIPIVDLDLEQGTSSSETDLTISDV